MFVSSWAWSPPIRSGHLPKLFLPIFVGVPIQFISRRRKLRVLLLSAVRRFPKHLSDGIVQLAVSALPGGFKLHDVGKQSVVGRAGTGSLTSLRFELRASDRVSERADDERTEVATAAGSVPYDTDMWFSGAWLLEGGTSNTSAWMILFQIHCADRFILRPPLAFGFDRHVDQFHVWTTSDQNRKPSPETCVTTYRFGPSSFPRDRWIRFVIRTRIHHSGGGSLNVWRDGEAIVDASNISIGYCNDDAMYLKMGIYRATAPGGETQVVRVANFEMSKHSLLDRVAKPLPISTVARGLAQ